MRGTRTTGVGALVVALLAASLVATATPAAATGDGVPKAASRPMTAPASTGHLATQRAKPIPSPRAVKPRTAEALYAGLLDDAHEAGRPGATAALRAFELTLGAVPGVKLGRVPRGSIDSGTGALRAVLAHWSNLTAAQHEAIVAVFDDQTAGGGPGKARRAGGDVDDNARAKRSRRSMAPGHREPPAARSGSSGFDRGAREHDPRRKREHGSIHVRALRVVSTVAARRHL